MSIFKIGVAKSDITDSRQGLQMQGMSDPRQQTEGVLFNLYSRAFVVEENKSGGKKVAIVVADIWACTKIIKDRVIEKLISRKLKDFNEKNLLIAGTHTHSAPGGFTGYRLFNQPLEEGDEVNIQKLVDGITDSIEKANSQLGAGKIYIGKGNVEGCGEQRSKPAYNNNPSDEKARYKSDTDKEMLLLKFVHTQGSSETPIGLLNWYAIHPTDLGQLNKKVAGDNKGYASQKFEEYAGTELDSKSFVAAFANANGGDVSGNVSTGVPDGVHDIEHMENHGNIHFEKAKSLFQGNLAEVTGDIEYWHKTVDMSSVTIRNTQNRTWPYALGVSFAAGSSHDSIPMVKDLFGNVVEVKPISEGVTTHDPFKVIWGIWAMAMSVKFGTKVRGDLPKEVNKGHEPKPILLAPQNDQSLVPSHLPIQILKIGNMAIAGVPGELTTMAGRRLRDRVKLTLTDHKVNEVALGTYANDYAQYITTKEEYEMQFYEGASTPFGPYTLDAYLQEFESLVRHEDQYVDCISDSLLDVWFYLSYKDINGNKVELNTGEKVKKFRFHVPFGSTDIQVFAKFLPTLGEWKNSNTVNIPSSLEGGQAFEVIFRYEELHFIPGIEPKTIHFYNDSLLSVRFFLWYTDSNGNVNKLDTPGKTREHTFEVPWNAQDIRAKAYYVPAFHIDDWQWSNEVALILTSGEEATLKFRDVSGNKLVQIS